MVAAPEAEARGLGRAVDGKVLSFGHAGILYENSFVMYDGVPLVNDRFQDLPLVVFFSTSDGTAVAWERRVNGRDVTFAKKVFGLERSVRPLGVDARRSRRDNVCHASTR